MERAAANTNSTSKLTCKIVGRFSSSRIIRLKGLTFWWYFCFILGQGLSVWPRRYDQANLDLTKICLPLPLKRKARLSTASDGGVS